MYPTEQHVARHSEPVELRSSTRKPTHHQSVVVEQRLVSRRMWPRCCGWSNEARVAGRASRQQTEALMKKAACRGETAHRLEETGGEEGEARLIAALKEDGETGQGS